MTNSTEYSPANLDFSMGQAVVDRVHSLLGYWDKNEICRFANAAYIEWFGDRCQGMVDHMSVKEFLGENYEKNLPYITAVLAGHLQSFETEVLTTSGSIKCALTHYYPDEVNGEVKGFFVQVSDVTAFKEMERELTSSNRKVTAQNEQLINFANIVSHNLKTYAYNLEGILRMVKEAEDADEKAGLFGYLENLSANFSSTVKNLDEIAEVKNSVNTELQTTDLYALISGQIELLQLQIRTEKITIKNLVSPYLMLRTNLAFMESVVLNLITNAIKYRDLSRESFLEISATSSKDNIILLFKDNGRGIDMEREGSKIFGLYQTFHGNADAKGLGLYITKFQVESMGGNISVESKKGEGTVFTVKLPVI